jgi:hypothetical protein
VAQDEEFQEFFAGQYEALCRLGYWLRFRGLDGLELDAHSSVRPPCVDRARPSTLEETTLPIKYPWRGIAPDLGEGLDQRAPSLRPRARRAHETCPWSSQ